jgi:hypothetical protein
MGVLDWAQGDSTGDRETQELVVDTGKHELDLSALTSGVGDGTQR